MNNYNELNQDRPRFCTNKKWTIAGLVAGTIIIVAVICILIFSGGKSSKTETLPNGTLDSNGTLSNNPYNNSAPNNNPSPQPNNNPIPSANPPTPASNPNPPFTPPPSEVNPTVDGPTVENITICDTPYDSNKKQ